MQLSGSNVAQQNSQNGNIYIVNGTLVLGKNIAGIVNAAIPNGNNIYVGNNAMPAALQLNYDEQISNSASVFVASGGTFNLNGHSETISNLNLGGVVNVNNGIGNIQGVLPGGLVTSSGSSTLYINYLRIVGGTISLGPNSRMMYQPNNFEGTAAGGPSSPDQHPLRHAERAVGRH